MNDLILLAALLDSPQHGWALKKLAGFLSGSGEMHNNIVYPVLKKFVRQGWVRRRTEPGHRGQTRAVYSITARGRQELMRRLRQFGEKEAPSSSEFRIRVGLFALFDLPERERVLNARDHWLTAREERFSAIRAGLTSLSATEWGFDVVTFLLDEVRRERKWIRALAKKSSERPTATRAERRRP